MADRQPVLTVGLFGLGTVGGGAAELLRESEGIRLKRVVVRTVRKIRGGIELPPDCVLSDEPDDILEDKEINCVIEVIGGISEAWTIIQKAIQKGKHVITANKSLIANHMNALVDLLDENPKVHFFYEAAVCGGIPIINAMRRGLACDDIKHITGIMNGTTNYILSKMGHEKLPYNTVLKEAQERGYAEEDPANDVEGFDARAKLCILAKLAFGLSVDERHVFCRGISSVSQEDFDYARIVGHTIKLLSTAEKIDPEKNSLSLQPRITLSVSPVMVPLSNPIASIDAEFNCVVLNSRNLGTSTYVGSGAGRFPTGNSIVSDVYELRSILRSNPNGDAFPAFPRTPSPPPFEENFSSEFYLRLIVDDCPGIIAKVARCLESHGISIFSILQTPITDHKRVPFAIITERCFVEQIMAVSDELMRNRGPGEPYSFLQEDPVFMLYMMP